jgi:hypothetical protein
MQSYSSRRHTVTYLLLAWVICFFIVDSWSHAASVIEPEVIIRQQLINRLLSGAASSSLREHEMRTSDVRTIVQRNLDPTIVSTVVDTKGIDFRFPRSGQQTEGQVAVLELHYATSDIALRMARKLSKRGGYFKQTKILTPFSYASVSDLLVIAFTENAGDKEIVRFINDVPAFLKQQS